MDKANIIQAILVELADEFEARRRSSKETRELGNHEESKAESKYDTLAIEENYLADGLAKQAQAAVRAASEIEKLGVREFAASDPIDVGALVEMDFGDAREWFFLAPSGGGTEAGSGRERVTVLTPDSPLGSQLMGRRKGDRTTAPGARVVRVL